MDLFSFPPIAFLLEGTYSLLMGLTHALQPLAGTAAATLAIIAVTLLARTALIPTGIAQARAEQTRVRLAPRLRELQRRHRRDPERLQREMLQLYRDEQSSPFAGMAPLLLQLPIVGLIYAVFVHTEIADHPNALLGDHIAGVTLGDNLWMALATPTLGTLLVFGTIGAILVAASEVSRRVLRPPATLDPEEPSATARRVRQALGFAPYLAVVFAAFVPLAAAIYLVVTTVWTLVQRSILRRRFPWE